jgi:hypothetical protein
MCQFSGSVCGGFEASASRGFLHANITNTGTLPSSYTLSVTNCSANIRPVEARQLGLGAGGTVSIVPFEIYVEDDRAQEGRFCWLVLFDARVSDQSSAAPLGAATMASSLDIADYKMVLITGRPARTPDTTYTCGATRTCTCFAGSWCLEL